MFFIFWVSLWLADRTTAWGQGYFKHITIEGYNSVSVLDKHEQTAASDTPLERLCSVRGHGFRDPA